MTDLADAHTDQPTLKGRQAVISGGTTGIGRAIAVLLASEGVKVFICGRTPEHLDDALARIREVGEGDGIALDLAERDGGVDDDDVRGGEVVPGRLEETPDAVPFGEVQCEAVAFSHLADPG